MKITWIGHACFKIESDGYSIVLDPYADGSVPGFTPVREKANMVLCSHGHGDHNAADCVELTNGGENPFTITRIETEHDSQMGKQRGMNTIHILDDGNSRIAHLGDLGCGLDEKQIELLYGLDAVMIPIGGYYTIDIQQAVKVIDQIKPKMILPMHYMSNEKAGIAFGYEVLDTVTDFLEFFDKVVTLEESTVDTLNIPAKVVVLKPQNI